MEARGPFFSVVTGHILWHLTEMCPVFQDEIHAGKQPSKSLQKPTEKRANIEVVRTANPDPAAYPNNTPPRI